MFLWPNFPIVESAPYLSSLVSNQIESLCDDQFRSRDDLPAERQPPYLKLKDIPHRDCGSVD